MVHGEREFYQRRALVCLAHCVDVHRHRGPGGGHLVRLGSNDSGTGGCHRSSGGRDRGGARSVRGGEEGGPRECGRSKEHAALILAPEARPLARLIGDRGDDGVDGQVGGLAVQELELELELTQPQAKLLTSAVAWELFWFWPCTRLA